MKYSILILFCIVLGHGSAQYTYFDQLKKVNDVNEAYADVYVTDSSFVTLGIRNDTSTVKVLREYTFDGVITNEKFFGPADTGNSYSLGTFPNTLNALPSDSGYYTCGSGTQTGAWRPYLIRFDADLDSVFTKTYSISDQITSNFTAYVPFENHLMVVHNYIGNVYDDGSGIDLVKLAPHGNIAWVKPIITPTPTLLHPHSNKITKCEDGFLIGGYVEHFLGPGGEWAVWVTKTDNEGEILWEYSEADDFDDMDDPFPDLFQKAIELSNGQVAMVSQKGYDYWEVFPQGEWHYNKVFIRFLDGDTGELIEEREYLSNHEMLFGGVTDMFETPDGGLIILGGSRTNYEDINLTGLIFPWLMKIDSQGNQEWYKEYYHVEYEDFLAQGMSGFFRDMEVTPDGGYVMVGQMEYLLTNFEDEHSWILKVDGCGDVEWSDCEYVGIDENSFLTNGFTISPNPASDIITIRVEDEQLVDQVSVYDLHGNLVLQKTVRNRASEIDMDVSLLADGLYLLQLMNNSTGRSYSRKVVVSG